MKRRRFIPLVAALAIGLVGACAATDDQLKGAAPETFVVSTSQNPTTLDPHIGVSGDKAPLYQIYDSLIEADPETLEPGPGLAKSWEFTDPQTLRLDLQEGVEFHDGTPFNAEAVKYNIERGQNKSNSTVASDLEVIDEVVVVNDLTVELRLKSPNTALIGILDDRPGLMVSPTADQKLGDQYGVSEAIGTGPFRLTSWTPGGAAHFERNEKYWVQGAPKIERLEMQFIEDSQTAANGLQSGAIHLALGLTTDVGQQLESVSGIEVMTVPAISFQIIHMDMTRPPFDDVRVRQAMNFAIDRTALNNAVQPGLGEPALLPFPSQHWGYIEDFAHDFDYNPERAKELLIEAGYEDGVDFTITVFSDPVSVRRAEIYQAQLAQVGLRMQITPLGVTEAVSQFLDEYRFNAAGMPWGGRPDPNQTLALLYQDGSYFYNGPQIPEIDELLERAGSAVTQEERVDVYRELYPLINGEHALKVPLYFNTVVAAQAEEVSGLRLNVIETTVRLRDVGFAASDG